MEDTSMQPFVVYVKADAAGRVTDVNSSAYLADAAGWIAVDEGFTDRHRHAQGNYFDQPLLDDRGVCRYQLSGSAVLPRTPEEMDADADALAAAREPTDTELLLALAAEHEYRLCLMERRHA